VKERVVNLLNYSYLYKRSVDLSGAESLTNTLEVLGNDHLKGCGFKVNHIVYPL